MDGKMDIDEYVDSIIKLTEDNTIIISELELKPDNINFGDIVCGQIQRREFFYLSPPCYLDGKRLIAIMILETGDIFPFFKGDEEKLRITIYNSLLGFAVVKSFTIYKIYVDKFTSDDNFNYILTTTDNIDIAALLYAKLSGKHSENMFMLYSTPLVVIKLPYINALPKYSALYIEGDGTNITVDEINVDTLRQVLYKNYENAKKSLQRVLDDNPQLAQLIEKLEIY
jgi:hypothetical protein